MDNLILIIPLFFFTALFYSMAGFGGGSTYLALLILCSIPYQSAPKIALICNIVVVTGGCYYFFKAGHLSLRKVIPFAATSIPCAYLGGSIPIGRELFVLLLAVSLGIASLRLLLSREDFKVRRKLSWKTAWAIGLPVGAALGLLSGLVGIGGGIFLLPVLYLLGWAHAKEAAAAASLFILVNSIAGLIGQFSKGSVPDELIFLFPLALAAFFGGQVGSRIGSGLLSKISMQRIAGLLIMLVSARLLWSLL